MPTYTQANRTARVESPLGEDVLLLTSFHGEERISQPFFFEVDVLSEDPEVDGTALLGKPLSVTMELGERGTRLFHGLVRRFTQRGGRGDLTSYRAEIVPWLWFLGLSRESRIYQDMSVPDIVAAVFQDLGYTDFVDRCTGTYPAREYCVQYRETHLDFVTRLLEDEGIFYYFEFDADQKKHTLVLADANAAIKPCPGQASAPLLPLSTGSDAVVLDFEREAAVHSTRVTLRDYDFQQPKLTLEAQVSGDGGPYEIYDYPGQFTDKGEASRYARIRLEEREFTGRSARGRSSCPAFVSGYRFELTDHYQRDANHAYTLVALRHRFSQGDYRAGSGQRSGEYENDFVAAPADLPVRPERQTPRPSVRGLQSALVVGPAGEEIYVDKYGRVKVQFYWDREGSQNEKSSCWMRVASGWAGNNWGQIQLPRVGQEVLVEFLEGDPDRPVVIGSVYNANQMPPYTLPGNKTQSGVKSRSSMNGGPGTFNELRFEDKQGAEQIFVHAQKDLATVVQNDENRHVMNDRTTEVENDETHEVGNDRVTEIGNDDKHDIGHDLNASIGNAAVVEARKSITLKVGQNSIVIDQKGVTVKGINVKIEGQAEASVKGAMLKLEGSGMSELKAPMTTVKGDGMLVVKGGLTMIN